MVKPWKDVLPAKKKEHKKDKRNREKRRKRLGKIGKRTAPPGLGGVHKGGKQQCTLGNAREQEKIDQIRLPCPLRVISGQPDNKGDRADNDQYRNNSEIPFFWGNRVIVVYGCHNIF